MCIVRNNIIIYLILMLSTISFSSNSKKSHNIHFNHLFFFPKIKVFRYMYSWMMQSRQKKSIEVNYIVCGPVQLYSSIYTVQYSIVQCILCSNGYFASSQTDSFLIWFENIFIAHKVIGIEHKFKNLDQFLIQYATCKPCRANRSKVLEAKMVVFIDK